MLNHLFNPKGSISNRDYWRACAALCALTLIAAMSFVGLPLLFQSHQEAFALAAFPILAIFCLYACYCVYGKRLHSLGRSRLWYIAIFIVHIGALRLMGYLMSLDVGAKFSVIDDLTRVMASYSEPSLGFYALGLLMVFLGVWITVVPVIICSLIVGMIKPPTDKGAKAALA